MGLAVAIGPDGFAGALGILGGDCAALHFVSGCGSECPKTDRSCSYEPLAHLFLSDRVFKKVRRVIYRTLHSHG
jgi:hypothetical protein